MVQESTCVDLVPHILYRGRSSKGGSSENFFSVTVVQIDQEAVYMGFSMQGIIPDILQPMKSASHSIILARGCIKETRHPSSRHGRFKEVRHPSSRQGCRDISHLGMCVSRRRDISHLGMGVSRRRNTGHLGTSASRRRDTSHLVTSASRR